MTHSTRLAWLMAGLRYLTLQLTPTRTVLIISITSLTLLMVLGIGFFLTDLSGGNWARAATISLGLGISSGLFLLLASRTRAARYLTIKRPVPAAVPVLLLVPATVWAALWTVGVLVTQSAFLRESDTTRVAGTVTGVRGGHFYKVSFPYDPGIQTGSEGAALGPCGKTCVFSSSVRRHKGEPVEVIIQKSNHQALLSGDQWLTPASDELAVVGIWLSSVVILVWGIDEMRVRRQQRRLTNVSTGASAEGDAQA